ncbi:HNH endonuclease signature motif containing protein [soil metagenome]
MNSSFDPALPDTRAEFGMAKAEVAQRTIWRASADLFRAADAVLRHAVLHPEVFVDEQYLRGDVTEFAVRAAVADLAIRLNLAESTVRDYAHVAATLRERLPVMWAWFREGEVSTQNARAAAELTLELPPECWPAFDEQLLDPARTLAPARFRSRARALREKLHTIPLVERKKAAAQCRRVWSEPDRDGMGWLHAYLPNEAIALITTKVDAEAFDLFREEDESRTMAQLRADVLSDLLVGGATGSPRITLALTVPVLALLGHGNELPMLEGVGPIDLDTARRLAVDAPTFTRLLTDPVSGSVLQLDPNQYRTTAAVKRWFSTRHATCDHPGCGRRIANCDLDHITAWADGGRTTIQNLAPLCRLHHSLKHQTRWQVDRPPGTELSVWTSPTGHVRESDPPPF